MTPDEQRLIDDLFDRLSQQGAGAKDRQADALIQQRLRQTPDAGYMLVQSAIVYQHQIAANEERIRELEDQLSANDTAPGRGSFLGGLLGGAGSRASVPASGRPVRSAASPPASPWGQAARGEAGAQPAAPAARGGGFLSNALTTAAGVAGGMLVADSLRGMFGGDAKPGDAQTASDQAALKDADATQDELQDAQFADDDFGASDDGGGIDI